MFLETMKWPEVDALDKNNVLVICCISALEQHSLHLPMGTDYLIGSQLVSRLEKKLPEQLLCLPTIWLGCSTHHMGFAGTITASAHTMLQILRDLAFSLRHHGFRKILFLNSHGGNRALLGLSIQDLGPEFPEMTIVGATYWEVVKEELTNLRETNFGGMGHACELETSIMLAINNSLVDRSKAHRDGVMSASRFARGEMLFPPSVIVFKPAKETSLHGGAGDPDSATSEKGELMLDAIVGGLTDLSQDILSGQI